MGCVHVQVSHWNSIIDVSKQSSVSIDVFMDSAVTWSVGQHHHHVMHIIFLLFCFRLHKVEEEAARGRSENEIYSFVPTDKHRNVIYWRWSSINNRFIKMLGEGRVSKIASFLSASLSTAAAVPSISRRSSSTTTDDVKKLPSGI